MRLCLVVWGQNYCYVEFEGISEATALLSRSEVPVCASRRSAFQKVRLLLRGQAPSLSSASSSAVVGSGPFRGPQSRGSFSKRGGFWQYSESYKRSLSQPIRSGSTRGPKWVRSDRHLRLIAAHLGRKIQEIQDPENLRFPGFSNLGPRVSKNGAVNVCLITC